MSFQPVEIWHYFATPIAWRSTYGVVTTTLTASITRDDQTVLNSPRKFYADDEGLVTLRLWPCGMDGVEPKDVVYRLDFEMSEQRFFDPSVFEIAEPIRWTRWLAVPESDVPLRLTDLLPDEPNDVPPHLIIG